MLVLSRKIDQSIVIGNNIRIQVLKVKGNTIRIGIEAPADVKILRGELAPYGVEGESMESTDSTQTAESLCRDAYAADLFGSEQVKETSAAPVSYGTTPMIEMDLNLDDVNALPNPFVVAHAM